MSLVRKLKPDRNITGALIPLSLLRIFGITALVFDLQVALYILAGLMGVVALYFLYVFTRTGNLSAPGSDGRGAVLRHNVRADGSDFRTG